LLDKQAESAANLLAAQLPCTQALLPQIASVVPHEVPSCWLLQKYRDMEDGQPSEE